MKSPRTAPLGFVAEGRRHHLRSEEFRALEREARAAVTAEFAARLAGADGWVARLRLRWQQFRALRRALGRLRPSLHNCYARGA